MPERGLAQEGDRLLDIGCGWGGLMAHAYSSYGATSTGVSVSTEQTRWARERYHNLPLEFRLQDYRFIDGAFHKAVSIEMVEAVGRRNLRTYFEAVRRALVRGGKFVCQAIVAQDGKPGNGANPWINRYIFPNGELPTVHGLCAAAEGLFNVLRMEMFGHDYVRTLHTWNKRFQAKRDELAELLGDRFCRRWEFYLLSCAGAFSAQTISVGQFTFDAR